MAPGFDHVGIVVKDIKASEEFYLHALKPLNYKLYKAFDYPGGRAVGIGPEGSGFLWLSNGDEPSRGVHLAFSASNRSEVDGFHVAALAAGGKDNGKPGLRPQYHASYYASFVLDLEGNNVEVVTHSPE